MFTQTKRFIRKMREDDLVPLTNAAPKGWGTRHVVVALCFTGSALSYAMRFNLSIAIVVMINRAHLSHLPSAQMRSDGSLRVESQSQSQPLVACPHLIESQNVQDHTDADLSSRLGHIMPNPKPKPTVAVENQGEFTWTEAEQGVILGSFFYGYIVMQVPGAMLSNRFGPKYPFGLGMLLTGICTLATPWAARTDKKLLILIRIMEGLGTGMQISCQTAIIAAWSPLNERSSIATIIYGGTFFGTAAFYVVSGYLINGNFLGGGWPSIFYTCGLATILWFVLWCFFVYDSPREHPRISNEERNYIESSYGGQTTSASTDIPVPWGEILKSPAVWANIVAHICHCWGIYTLLTEMPTYMRTVLHFEIKNNAWLSALPYLSSWVVGLIFANLADSALRKNLVSLITVRRTAQLIAHGLSAITLVLVAYSNCDRVFSVTFLIASVTFLGIGNSGFMINYVDLSPQFASLIVGAVNMIANLCGIFAPYVAGHILNNNPSVENWRTVFLLAAAVLFFAAIFYSLLSSSDVQPWNNVHKTLEDTVKKPTYFTPTSTITTKIDSSKGIDIHHQHHIIYNHGRRISDDLVEKIHR